MFYRKGGIGVFSLFMLRAVREWRSETKCRVIIKHDKELNGHRGTAPDSNFNFTGRWPSPMRTPAFASNLITRGVIERPDLIITTHLHFTPAARLLGRLTATPYWTIAHGIEAWDLDNPRLVQSLQKADSILAVSSFTRDRLLKEQQLSPDQVSILPNTVDEKRFTIAPKPQHLLTQYGLKPDQPVILTVSRLVASDSYKGYDSVIRALPAIRKVIPNVHYLLVGTGNDKARILRLIADLGLQQSVTLTGYVDDDDLPAHYNLCDVFAMPSKREGFGIVYLEAMACGKPTIGGNKDGAIDALLNGELGALVDPDDTIEIASTLISILRKTYPHELMYQPEALRKRVLDVYGYERFRATVAEKLDRFFELRDAKASSLKSSFSHS
jgi:glycosyltransferase involved in cell wall biosynthesis